MRNRVVGVMLFIDFLLWFSHGGATPYGDLTGVPGRQRPPAETAAADTLAALHVTYG